MSPAGHVLIVDDEAALRQTLARVLQRAGLEVTTAGSGGEALALLDDPSLDMVYLDIRMPDMTGLEVLKRIHAKLPEMPVILVTAQPDVNSALEALRTGATDYLLKPLQPQAVIDRTLAVLAGKERDRRKRGILSQIEVLRGELRSLDEQEAVTAVSAPKPADGERFLIRGKLTLDLHARRITIAGKPAGLPPTTFEYLLVLARHSPDVVDFITLVSEAQGYEADPREAQDLVKWHVHQIRQAIESDAHDPAYLITVRGKGYRLVVD